MGINMPLLYVFHNNKSMMYSKIIKGKETKTSETADNRKKGGNRYEKSICYD